MDKAVGAGRADGLFVEALGVELAAFEAGDLGADQRGAVLEILRAVLRPDLELAGDGRPEPPDAAGCSSRRCRIAECRARERAVEMILRRLEECWRRPEQRLRLRCRLDGGRIVAGEEARLQLADPVPALGAAPDPDGSPDALEPALIELLIVEGAERRRSVHAASGSARAAR